MEMEKITLAKPLEDYRIEIHTASGYRGIFDAKPYLDKGVFRELRDKAYFNQVRPAHHGIMWPHEQDLSTDTVLWDIEHSPDR
jgi:hypothetical protein